MGRLRNISASFKAAAFPTASTSPPPKDQFTSESPDQIDRKRDHNQTLVRESSGNSIPISSSNNNTRNPSPAARPTSTFYTPPTIGTAQSEEIVELKPVFSYLSSHANKLYQEGYFLKLDDLDTNGKPNAHRAWTECFAQLVGTILSFWNAEALDVAGHDGEVAPSFINLADASIKMIETLPTRNHDVQPLQNVLSISTAGKNRYLLHFNSLHSLTQWTAGIRLAMFENASLQELYTGSLIAGKGRNLNSINQIMTKTKFRIEDWARVRFGAGTPWRRCWCVIEPPDEKEWQRSQKKLGKRSVYDKPVYPKGDIKFYDTKKIKKAMPIATITDAYSAYAVYPHSKPLINESTLVKLEGKITIHSNPESKTEGFVFVMPEVHPAVSGFEMMLRWLLPVYDTFSLYGRPNRLLPDTLDTRSLMFAMPKERRYGYLDIIDVASLIHSEDSDKWTEREWRRKLKEAVSRRMSMQSQGRVSNIENERPVQGRQGLKFPENTSMHSLQPSHKHNQSTDAVFETPRKTHTAPIQLAHNYHNRSASEHTQISPPKARQPYARGYSPMGISGEEFSPQHPDHAPPPIPPHERQPLRARVNEAEYMNSANSSDSELHGHVYAEDVQADLIQQRPLQPVVTPPEFNHLPNEQPKTRPIDRPEMRREKSRMSDATLAQLNPRVLEDLRREGTGYDRDLQEDAAASAAAYAWRQNGGPGRGVINETPADVHETLANAQQPTVVNNSSSTSIHTIKRKPLPPRTNTEPIPIDIRPQPVRTQSESPDYSMPYDRDSSPDYESHSSQELPIQNVKIRGGTRKIVGDPNAQDKPTENDFVVDFGVTQKLTPENSRPSSAAGRKSPFDALGRSDTSSGRRSPFDSLGMPSSGRKSPLNPLFTQTPRTPERSPKEYLPNSRPQSYAWQPGTRPSSGSQEGLSPEQFVQQRAMMAMKPQGYVAQRNLSSGRFDQFRSEQGPGSSISKSPRKLQKRMSTSRNASANSIDFSAHLSAREQEHVAKMTGGPLLNLRQQGRTPDHSVGLIGAIEAREQEKRNMKEGVQGHMVQAAIEQRAREARALQVQQAQVLQRNNTWYGAPQQQYQDSNPYHFTQFQNVQPSSPGRDYNSQQPQYLVNQSTSSEQEQMMMQQGYFPQQTQSQTAYVSPSPHTRSQSQASWSQYGGFYAPQG